MVVFSCICCPYLSRWKRSWVWNVLSKEPLVNCCSASCIWYTLLPLCVSDGRSECLRWGADQVGCFVLDGVELPECCWSCTHPASNTKMLFMEEEPFAQEEFLYCCGAATQLLKFGSLDCWLKVRSNNSSKVLFLIIPGNPGIVYYYKPFMQILYKILNQKYPIWAISHAGHCVPSEDMEMMEDIELEDVFGLNGQVEHKLTFLMKNVPKDIKLVLIGHSIGCHMILEMMKREPNLKVLKAVLLFPTIERMAESPQESVKASLVRWALQGLQSLDEATVTASLNLFNVDCAANAMYLGSQEMVQVVQRDDSTIRRCLDKLIFYYGYNDRWCPIKYYEDMKRSFPEGTIHLCQKGIRHAFVLDANVEMAQMLIDWLCTDLANL
ncbi:lipid droplet-associated hydrolase isoform X2 [Heterodontus francisci]|uniref:lipid droplet-associated hydrolase isoform X2 n=1 Tax=Heterodontus francisci TaxID=7792 RepID=UPI00355B0D27